MMHQVEEICQIEDNSKLPWGWASYSVKCNIDHTWGWEVPLHEQCEAWAVDEVKEGQMHAVGIRKGWRIVAVNRTAVTQENEGNLAPPSPFA